MTQRVINDNMNVCVQDNYQTSSFRNKTLDLVKFLGNMAKRTDPGFVNYRNWWFCDNNLYKDTFASFIHLLPKGLELKPIQARERFSVLPLIVYLSCRGCQNVSPMTCRNF